MSGMGPYALRRYSFGLWPGDGASGQTIHVRPNQYANSGARSPLGHHLWFETEVPLLTVPKHFDLTGVTGGTLRRHTAEALVVKRVEETVLFHRFAAVKRLQALNHTQWSL